MYHAMVKRSLLQSFEEVNRGNYDHVLRQFSRTGVEHSFSGDSALGGRRLTYRQIRAWYRRLPAVFPDLRFDITRVAVSGPPWRTTALLEWTDSLTDVEGREYRNQGVHLITLTWGKVTSLRIYCDTAKLDRVLAVLAEQGRAEAAAPPIGSTDG